MGEVNVDRRDEILNDSKRVLTDMYGRIDNMSREELMLLIIVLGQYLYALVSVNCVRNNNSYTVYPIDVAKNLGKVWGKYAEGLIVLRNNLCHHYGNSFTETKSVEVYANILKLKEFLKFLNLGKSDGLDNALNNLSNLK